MNANNMDIIKLYEACINIDTSDPESDSICALSLNGQLTKQQLLPEVERLKDNGYQVVATKFGFDVLGVSTKKVVMMKMNHEE
jgi:hypothetical protein